MSDAEKLPTDDRLLGRTSDLNIDRTTMRAMAIADAIEKEVDKFMEEFEREAENRGINLQRTYKTGSKKCPVLTKRDLLRAMLIHVNNARHLQKQGYDISTAQLLTCNRNLEKMTKGVSDARRKMVRPSAEAHNAKRKLVDDVVDNYISPEGETVDLDKTVIAAGTGVRVTRREIIRCILMIEQSAVGVTCTPEHVTELSELMSDHLEHVRTAFDHVVRSQSDI
jgi:hypothetical protein